MLFRSYYNVGFNGYFELKDLINWIKSDNPRTFLTLQNGMKIKFFPTKKIKLTVDSAACVRNGIVPPYFADRIVDSIYWTIRSNQLYKNDVMLLDLVASTKWERPLYFAAPGSVAHVLSIDSFAVLEGYVYKFMPVRTDRSDRIAGLGTIDARGSYKRLKDMKWGNLEDPKVYVDPESLNNAIRPKTNFIRVAQGLANLGLNKEAEEMLDTYIRYFPDSKIPFDMYMTPYAELYYKLGKPEKANAIVERVVQIYQQDLAYYASYSPDRREYFNDDIERALGTLNNLARLSREYKQDSVSKVADSAFNMQMRLFQQ